MNKQFIKKAFKNIDKTDPSKNISMACDLIRAYCKEFGINTTTDYMKYGLGWNLEQQILNRRGKDTIQSLSVDYVLSQIESIKFQYS